MIFFNIHIFIFNYLKKICNDCCLRLIDQIEVVL